MEEDGLGVLAIRLGPRLSTSEGRYDPKVQDPSGHEVVSIHTVPHKLFWASGLLRSVF